MSIALMIAAAYLPPDAVTATEKLALMKLADSADDDTRLSVPTQRRLVAWVGVSEKRVSTVITSLVAKGLVERVVIAREGRAAVYKVFPQGVPVTPQREELDDRLKGLRLRPTNPRLARTPKKPRRKPGGPARTYLDVQERQLEATQQERAGVPEGPPDGAEGAAASSDGAGFRQGNPDTEGAQSAPRVSLRKPSGFPDRNHQGFPTETPSFPSSRTSPPSSTTPPTPTADAAGEPAPAQPSPQGGGRGCPKHPEKPGRNCRGCGTTARAARDRERKAAEDAARASDSEFWEQWHAEADARRRRADDEAASVRELRRAVREANRVGRSQLKR